MKSLFSKFLKSVVEVEKNRLAMGVFLLLGPLCLGLALTKDQSVSVNGATEDSNDTGVDTYIPSGYVLVPIEVQNIESLDSILGQTGVVDLFEVRSNGEKSARRLARQIKIMRAPLNPRQFAVLAPESQAAAIVKSGEPYFVVIQNPQASSTSFESSTSGTRQTGRISVGNL